MGMIYDSAQFNPARLLAILAQRWPDVRMVPRGPAVEVDADDFGTWVMSV